MSDEIEIPVEYKGKELVFKARLLNFGYSYKLQVDVYGVSVLFEPDEERNFRIVIPPENIEKENQIDLALLESILTTIKSVTN